jgi:hypothetical protein
MGKKVRIIVSVLVIAIIGILIVPMESDNSESITTVYESDIVSSDDINMDQIIIDQAIQEYSIIETNRVFTESDQSLIDQFLDESGLPSSSEKLGIEVQTVLFDSYQKQFPSSSILDIPQEALSVIDEQGRVLDLGSIQTSFLGITTGSERGSEQQFNLDGTVKFYLDNDLIATKKLYSSESGDSNTHQLTIQDSLQTFDRPTAFTFTLSDEGRDWKDKSNHVYRAVITEINAELRSNNDYKKYTWNGEKIAYELKVTVDGTKKVILDEANNAINIFKDDSTIQICGMSAIAEIPYDGWKRWYSDNPRVTVKVPMTYNELSTVISNMPSAIDLQFENPVIPKPSFGGKHWFGKLAIQEPCSAKIDGIPRGTNVIIGLDYDDNSKDIEYNILTPLSQKNYHVTSTFNVESYNVKLGTAYVINDGETKTNILDESELESNNQFTNIDDYKYSRSITQSSQASENENQCRDNCD